MLQGDDEWDSVAFEAAIIPNKCMDLLFEDSTVQYFPVVAYWKHYFHCDTILR